jgi:2-polyprenyl-3-methyl-5-hydroxy-6-metoxy-1,4-benzoquinol methylase
MPLTDGRPSPLFDRMCRSPQTEILDDPISTLELAPILRDLARFNGVMQGHRPVLRWLDRATRGLPANVPLTVLDIGCGYGDLLRAIRDWGNKRGRKLRLVGIDLSAQVIDVARGVTPITAEIEYEAADIFAYQAARPIDFVVTSLVTHHLPDAMIERFLKWMEATATRGWMIYDLQRSIVPFYFIALAGPLLRLHPVVVYDGRISVARSLTRKEWGDRIRAAGLTRAEVDIRWFMFRFAIGRLT